MPMINCYDHLNSWWESGRKIKGCVSLRGKRYLAKKGDTFELWALRPDQDGLLAAVATKNGVTAVNVEKYNSRCYSVWDIFGVRVRAEYAALSKDRNYSRVCRANGGWVPFVDGSGLNNGGRLINNPAPMCLRTSEETEKKIRAKAKEWKALFDTMVQLLKKDLKCGEYRLDMDLPLLDDPVDGGVALALLEWSRSHTWSHTWEYGRGYVDAPNFSKNLIDKCAKQLREHWRRTASDTTWEPVPMKG